ncbi:hypothetical protein IKG60_00470 [Candidatus Saccharibacteria bacterium]|nr:hypothetical protein [Candidatus Saccharibacteria bacterium]
MPREYELWRIRNMEKEASRRKQSAWDAYVDVGRRHDDAYYNLVLAKEDLKSARRRLEYGRDEEIEFELASKRYRAALEELEFQEIERERIMVEFGVACSEHKHWSEVLRQRSMGVDRIKACG